MSVMKEDGFFSGGQDHFILGEPLMPYFYHRMDERLSGFSKGESVLLVQALPVYYGM
jgi:hypothetical protein